MSRAASMRQTASMASWVSAVTRATRRRSRGSRSRPAPRSPGTDRADSGAPRRPHRPRCAVPGCGSRGRRARSRRTGRRGRSDRPSPKRTLVAVRLGCRVSDARTTPAVRRSSSYARIASPNGPVGRPAADRSPSSSIRKRMTGRSRTRERGHLLLEEELADLHRLHPGYLGEAGDPVDGLLARVDVDDGEAGDEFLRLGIWPVGDRRTCRLRRRSGCSTRSVGPRRSGRSCRTAPLRP